MEVTRVLHMNGGMGDASYAKNSLLQVLYVTHTIRKLIFQQIFILIFSDNILIVVTVLVKILAYHNCYELH